MISREGDKWHWTLSLRHWIPTFLKTVYIYCFSDGRRRIEWATCRLEDPRHQQTNLIACCFSSLARKITREIKEKISQIDLSERFQNFSVRYQNLPARVNFRIIFQGFLAFLLVGLARTFIQPKVQCTRNDREILIVWSSLIYILWLFKSNAVKSKLVV